MFAARIAPYLPWIRRFFLVLLGALVVAGSVLRVQEAFVHNPLDHIFSDPQRHWDHAREPLSPAPWAIIDPPLYQMWLSVVQKWSLGTRELIGLYAGALSVATPFFWYLFLREYLRSRVLALLGWAILSWVPSWIGIYSYFMTETLLLPLLGASLWQTMRAKRKRTVASFCGMAALWTLAGLTRGIAVPLGGLAGAWVWFHHPHKLRTFGASAVVVLAITGPLAYRNHHFLAEWSPFGTGWPITIYAMSGRRNIHIDMTRDGANWSYEFGSPSMYAKQLAPLSDWDSKRMGTARVSVDLRKGATDWKAEYDKTAAYGSEVLRLRWENLILVMLGQSWPDNNTQYAVARAALDTRWVWAPLFVVVAVASLVMFRQTWRRPLLPVLIAAWFAVQAVSLFSVNEGRYRKPIEGLLVAQVLALLDRGRLSRPRFASPPS